MPISDKRFILPPAQAARAASGPVRQLALLSGAAGLAIVGLIWALSSDLVAVAIGLGAYALSVATVLAFLRAQYPHRSIGACNAVTVLRLALACVLISTLFAEVSGWSVVAIASLAFALDGADGWLARRAGLVSAFGARFDMEVDAILAMTLSMIVFQNGEAGAYVLLLGLPRYLFWGAQFIFPWLTGALPDRFSRKLVCVVQIAVLLVLLLPVVTSPLSNLLAGGAAAGLVWSFAVDIRALWAQRA